LQADAVVPTKVLTPYAHLATDLFPAACSWVAPPYRVDRVQDWCETVVHVAEERGAAFVVLGRVTCGDAVFDRLRGIASERLRPTARADDVIVFEVAGIQLDWIASANLRSVAAGAAGGVVARVILRDEVAKDAVLAVGLRTCSPAGEISYWPLTCGVDGVYQSPIPSQSGCKELIEAGWKFDAVICSRLGRYGVARVAIDGR
jgi:hypothetical protein